MQSTEKKFTELYTKEADAILRFCLARTSDRDVAKDVTEDAFTKLWETMQKDTEIKNPRAYLYMIARNMIIDWYRKKKTVSLDEMKDNDLYGDVEEINDGAHIEAEMNTEARFLISKIRMLGKNYEEAVYLRFIEGMGPQEIAEILGESVNVVSVRISRGVEKLREITGYSKKT